MTRIGKRLAAVFLAVAMAIAFIPVLGTQTAYAEDLPELQNVNISSDGILTWDAYPGTVKYIIVVEGWFQEQTTRTFDLNETIDSKIESGLIEKTGTYEVIIRAFDGSSTIAESSIAYHYDSPAVPIVVGSIQNAGISAEGLLTWDAYDGTDTYWIGVDGYSRPTGGTSYELDPFIDEMILDGDIENSGTHSIIIEAYNNKSQIIAKWEGTYEYVSSAVPIVAADLQNVMISEEGMISWDPYPGTVKYWVEVNGQGRDTNNTSYNLQGFIDALVENGSIAGSGTVGIKVIAKDAPEGGVTIAQWSGTYDYTSEAVTIVVGDLNAGISSDGILSWDDYTGAVEYWVGIDGGYTTADGNSFALYTRVNELYFAGLAASTGTYVITIDARNARGTTVATWSGTFPYTVAVPMKDVVVSDVSDIYLYPGETAPVEPQLYYLTKTLAAGTDYTYKLTDSKGNIVTDVSKGGTYYAVFEGLGVFKGQKKVAVHVSNHIESCVPHKIPDQTYTGSAIRPDPVMTFDGRKLVKDVDFTVTYKDNVNAGPVTVIMEGKGDFWGTYTQYFYIVPKAITPAVTLSASSYTYNGKVQKPTVTVKDGSTKLAASQYDVTYASGLKNVGTYKVTVKMKGNYSGSKTVSFKINPKGTTLSKVTKAKKAATVKWKKQAAKMSTSRITGYQIQLATDSKFTKNKKTVNVKGYSKTSKKVTGLKGGKKYWVRIRTYKKVGSTTYYSPWSKAKTVTTGK